MQHQQLHYCHLPHLHPVVTTAITATATLCEGALPTFTSANATLQYSDPYCQFGGIKWYSNVLLTVPLAAGYTGKVVIVNKEKLHLDGPCLLVSNHPNTMIDPLFVASRSGRVMFFLANASLYKHPFTNWFFSTFYCIPIERPQDTGGKRAEQ